jgi:hypothetical protein
LWSRRLSAITLSRIMATATNSGAAHFKVCASVVTIPRSVSSRRAVTVPMSGSMAGRSTRGIRSTRAGNKLEEVDATTSAKKAALSKSLNNFARSR